MKLSRRSFLKKSTATAAAMTMAGGIVSTVIGKDQKTLAAGPGNKWPGRVAINFNKNAVVMNGANATLAPTIVKTMVDDSIKLLTGEATIGAAWKAIFPSTLSATSKIVIKVPLGCANSVMAPHWSSVKAITDGLQLMDFSGTKLPAANITIYDWQCSDNLSNYGYTATNFPGVHLVRESGKGSGYTDGARGLQYTPSLAAATFLINVFRAGGHGNEFGGFTLGFKNHYGTYDPAYHDSTNSPPYLRDINCTGVVFTKNVLSVCVGIFGANAPGSPGDAAVPYYNYAKTMDSTITNTSFPSTTIIMSTDPVTAEMQTIKMMRLNKIPAGGYAVADMPSYLRASAGVTGALSGTTYNIGIIDEASMDIRRIINGTPTTSVLTQTPKAANNRIGIIASQIKGGNGTFIEFMVPASHCGAKARIEIFNTKGVMVRTQSQKVLGNVNHFVWNETDRHGNRAGKGMYVVQLISGSQKISTLLTLVR